MQNMDRLFEAVAQKGPVCVGLDTDFSYLPEGYAATGETRGEAVLRFNKDIIAATKNEAGCYKVQIAYYEAMGLDGLIAYSETLRILRSEGLLAIADIKRGDIAKTAEMYAKAHFEGDFEADFVTLAPYMWIDSIEPYATYFDKKGAFVLCRTSNGGAKDFEYETLADVLDFTVNDNGQYKKNDIEKLNQRIINEAQTATSSLHYSPNSFF